MQDLPQGQDRPFRVAGRQRSVSAVGDEVERFEHKLPDQDLAPGHSHDRLSIRCEVPDPDRDDFHRALFPPLVCVDDGSRSAVAEPQLPRDLFRYHEPRERTSWLDAVRAWALDLPAADGRLGMVGFSWGGSAAFAYAVDRPELDALVVYYGETPEAESDYARIDAPVLGLYGGDLPTAATVPRAVAAMAAAGKSFETTVYDGATVFLKAQEGLDANRRATEDAWPRTVAFLRRHLAE